jgi:ATP-dependent RNA helicase DDX23/PRP28
LEDAKAAVPHQLASHEASKTKPGSIEGKSRRDTVIFAKK